MTDYTARYKPRKLTIKLKTDVYGQLYSVPVATVRGGTSSATSGRFDLLTDVIEADPHENDTVVYDADTDKYVVKQLPEVDGGNF